MAKPEILDYTQNRELSWLRFNQRVLEEARDESVPLMERMKFVAIFTSNLDEFFMIRVGSLYDMAAVDNKKLDIRSGMTPEQQLDAIYRAVAPLYKERDKTYAEIKKQLQPYGVCGLDIRDLEQQEKREILDHLLAHFNDGRKKTLYCTAVNLLELSDLQEAAKQLSARKELTDLPVKERAKAAAELLQEIGDRRGIVLKLVRKK